eukprot:c10900_g1_i1.p1 GENE.c10900_g1_i1~~c10900_g1_i1.p1  ORF type:complete len:188 (+),score=46.32 c10900_g1_i1:181-744(+)
MQLVAYALQMATVSSVVQNLRIDAVRSLQSRIDVLEQELQLQHDSSTSDDDQSTGTTTKKDRHKKEKIDLLFQNGTTKVEMTLPRRIFWKLCGDKKNVLACDYCTDDFDEEETLERCRDVMGATAPEIELIHWEAKPPSASVTADHEVSPTNTITATASPHFSWLRALAALLSLLILLVALAIHHAS